MAWLVFTLLSCNGVIVYIGQSGNIRDRILQHTRRFVVDSFEFLVIPRRRERMERERLLIREQRPIHNILIPNIYERPISYLDTIR